MGLFVGSRIKSSHRFDDLFSHKVLELPATLFAVALILLVSMIISLLVPGVATAADIKVPEAPPALYVLDEAGVLNEYTKATIIGTSQDLARATDAQIAVVTLNSLDGRSIEEVSLAILRKWGLGDKKLNNGVLILVVPSERQSRIEVGYGLEGALPDAKTGRIQDDYMLPSFKQGDYDRGIMDGYNVIVKEVAKEYNTTIDTRQDSGTTPASKQNYSMPLWEKILMIIGLVILFWVDQRFLNGFIFGFILGTLFRMGSGRGGGGGGSFGGGGSGGGGGSSRSW